MITTPRRTQAERDFYGINITPRGGVQRAKKNKKKQYTCINKNQYRRSRVARRRGSKYGSLLSGSWR